ncbi:MAG: inositol monophosphatase [Bacteroidia bacterium]|nr:inositol monophosphatase [Bacteroidia bacterium]MCC6769286.1 inositol monophosphatase [Bacteroidia bacterium]
MNQKSHLAAVCDDLRRITKEVGRFIKLEQERLTSQGVESKGLNDFVTYVDKAAEVLLVRELSVLLPNSGFITEEKTIEQEEKPYIWIIDPIDGTTNFIHGVPLYSISIALQYYGKTVMGLIYEVVSDECFWAYEGSGVHINDRKVQVSQVSSLSDSLLVTGFPYRDQGKLDQWLELFKALLYRSHGVRRLGSAAIDLAWVACGRLEAFYEYGLAPWDVAAGAFLVQQAGGTVTDFSGNDTFIFGKELIATNGVIHNDLLREIQQYFVANQGLE